MNHMANPVAPSERIRGAAPAEPTNPLFLLLL